MDLFKLVGSIFIDTDAANDSLAKTDKKASSIGDTLGKVGKGAAAVGTAVVGAATAVGSSVMAMASDAASEMDVIDKASQRMGINAETYQEFAHAAELSGVEMSTLEKAAKKLEGTDLNFEDAIAQIYAMDTAEQRAAKAAELFGDSVAYQMTPMLNSTAGEMGKMRQEAHQLGLVFGNEAVKDGAKLNDMLSNVQKSFKSLGTNLGNSLMPIVSDVLELILSYVPTIQGMMENLAPILANIFENVMPPLMDLAATLLPVIFDLFNELLPPISELISSLLPVFVTLLSQFIPFIVQIANAVLPVIVQLVNALLPVLQPLLEVMKPILDLIIALIVPAMQLITDVIKPIISLVSKGLSKALEAILVPIRTVGDVFAEVFNAIPLVVKTVANAIIWTLNKAIDGVNILLTPLRIIIAAVGNMFGASWTLDDVAIPHIPALAKGGTAIEGGSAIVGEAGAELVDLPRGATVTPLKGKTLDEIIAKMDILIDRMTAMTKMGIYLDGSVLVGQIAPDMDSELGRIAMQRGRLTV